MQPNYDINTIQKLTAEAVNIPTASAHAQEKTKASVFFQNTITTPFSTVEPFPQQISLRQSSRFLPTSIIEPNNTSNTIETQSSTIQELQDFNPRHYSLRSSSKTVATSIIEPNSTLNTIEIQSSTIQELQDFNPRHYSLRSSSKTVATSSIEPNSTLNTIETQSSTIQKLQDFNPRLYSFKRSSSNTVAPYSVSKRLSLSSNTRLSETSYSLQDIINQKYLKSNQLVQEFNTLAQSQKAYQNKLRTGNNEKNYNRYPDILPFAFNVHNSRDHYFNASNIQFSESKAAQYVATQAPLPTTFSHFWNAYMDSESDTIVMLTNLIENRKVKAHFYFPTEVGKSETFGNIQLTLSNLEIKGPITKRTFLLEEGGKSKTATHFHFTKWPDFGVADVKEFSQLLKDVQETHQTGPLFVHCSAGVGRAGTFIATHSLMEDIHQGADEINVAKRVDDLRKQRMYSVQTKEQFNLIYDTIKECVS